MCCPRWDPGTEKGPSVKTKEIWAKCGLQLIVTNVPHSNVNNRGTACEEYGQSVFSSQFFYKSKAIIKLKVGFFNEQKVWMDILTKIYKWPISIWEDAPHYHSLGKCKLKLQLDVTSYQLENQKEISVGKDLEKLEFFSWGKFKMEQPFSGGGGRIGSFLKC